MVWEGVLLQSSIPAWALQFSDLSFEFVFTWFLFNTTWIFITLSLVTGHFIYIHFNLNFACLFLFFQWNPLDWSNKWRREFVKWSHDYCRSRGWTVFCSQARRKSSSSITVTGLYQWSHEESRIHQQACHCSSWISWYINFYNSWHDYWVQSQGGSPQL